MGAAGFVLYDGVRYVVSCQAEKELESLEDGPLGPRLLARATKCWYS